jgi:hypothetical protein
MALIECVNCEHVYTIDTDKAHWDLGCAIHRDMRFEECEWRRVKKLEC